MNFEQLRNRWRFRILPTTLILVGLALLIYVTIQYATMYSEQRRLAREWAEQQLEPASPAAISDGLTRLSIPKINLNAVVIEGTGRKALLLGPGHVKDTAVPGESGNSVITGHRDTFFRHIYELAKGDVVTVQRNGKVYKYEVSGKKIVDASDVSVMQPSSEKRLTLITCYPIYYIGPAPERLVVFSKMLEDGSQVEAEKTGILIPAEVISPQQTIKH